MSFKRHTNLMIFVLINEIKVEEGDIILEINGVSTRHLTLGESKHAFFLYYYFSLYRLLYNVTNVS